MILVDANILIYAVNRDSPEHGAAEHWLTEQFKQAHRVGLPWPSLLGFLRIVTNPRHFPSPLSVDRTWAMIENWLDRPNVWIPLPTERHQSILGRLLRSSGGGANLIPDADLAALAIEHGQILCSADGDFARFPGLRWQNPLR